MIQIAPSILSADFTRLGEEIRKVEEAGADWIHVDVMDGHFVPNITIGPFVVEAARKATTLPLDVHLMIEKPERYLKDFAEAGSDLLTVHVETCPHLHRTVQVIKELGKKAGVSLNPATPLSMIEPIVEDVDLILVMSVNPGFSGQKFIPFSLEKVRQARALIERTGSKALLEVDGGVKVENTRALAEAGAEVLVSGSTIFGSKDYKDTIARMKEEGTIRGRMI